MMEQESEIPEEARNFKASSNLEKRIGTEELKRRQAVREFYDRMVVSPTPKVEMESKKLESKLEALSEDLTKLTDAMEANPEDKSPKLEFKMDLMATRLAIKTVIEETNLIKEILEQRL